MIQIGKKYKFIGSGSKECSGAGLKIGRFYKVKDSYHGSYSGPRRWLMINGDYVFEHELEVLQTKESINEEVSKLKTEISEKETEIKTLEDKLELMEKHGLETIDDETIKVYSIMKEIGIDDIEKVKNIVKILNK